MTSPHDQPQSRRAVRRALEAENAGVESFAQPTNDRRSQAGRSSGTPSSVPSSAPTDVTYRTQVRPRVPHYNERTVSAMPVVERAELSHRTSPPVAPPSVPEHDVERVRRRDFRPRVVDDEPQTHAMPPTYDTPLDYHTQLTHRPPAPATDGPPPVPPAHVVDDRPAVPDVASEPAIEQTLTRRELRELRAAQLATTPESAALAYAPGQVEPSRVEPNRVDSGLVDPVPVEPVHLAAILIEPVFVEPEPAQAAATAPVPHVPTSTGSHWSVGIHDDEDPFENTFSRQVGSTMSLNTNALVLPEMPTGSIAGPVAGTGEIIVTGMIAVSPLQASTGTVPTLHDSPDLDDLFDADDREVSAPDSAPVSALKAISSHTSSHTVMTGKPSSSNTITTVLVASTVGMAVIAIGLFVVAAANGLF